MDTSPEHPSITRIERALARIEAASRQRAYDAESLARRHDALRQRMSEAIEALDQVIAREEQA